MNEPSIHISSEYNMILHYFESAKGSLYTH